MTASQPTVCVMGLGYIGLPTASLLATKGHRVVGVDIDADKLRAIRTLSLPGTEPSLDVLIKSAVQSGQLELQSAPASADVFILAVPTPIDPERRADLSAVRAATEAVAPKLAPGNLVILESTSPVGTTEQIARWLQDARPDLEIPVESHAAPGTRAPVHVAHCPERVLPGRILEELVDNDRTVGGVTSAATARAVAFYRRFVSGEIVGTDARTAELSKLCENAYRDVNIAFANELANVCSVLDVDVWSLIEIANRHPRVQILSPGPGVGGHCIAVDPWFVVASAPDQTDLIRAARRVNDERPKRVADEIADRVRAVGATAVACLGLSYKADVDDLRESPAVEVVERLRQATTAEILVVEPHTERLPPRLGSLSDVRLADLEDAMQRAEVVALLVDHRAFRAFATPSTVRAVIDTRGLWRRPGGA